MKNLLFVFAAILHCAVCLSQETTGGKSKSDNYLQLASQEVCKCIDSIPAGISKDALTFRIKACIDEKAGAYQILSKLYDATSKPKDQKTVDVPVNISKESADYKKYYYEMESYLMEHCAILRDRVAADIPTNLRSMSENPEAIRLYNLARDETTNKNYEKSIEYYAQAIKIDPSFITAYDYMGICYRRIEEYDKALECYRKSLELDPNGIVPLQNSAVVYLYKKDYDNAIKAYERLGAIDPENPEVFYGLGQTYVSYLNEYEKGLDNLCKAYNIYTKQNSPFRDDAKKMILTVYAELQKQGKKAAFKEILNKNNITTK